MFDFVFVAVVDLVVVVYTLRGRVTNNITCVVFINHEAAKAKSKVKHGTNTKYVAVVVVVLLLLLQVS